MLTLEWLASLWERHQTAYHAPVAPISLAEGRLVIGDQPRLMGVVNLSPQSWYRESVCLTPEAAIRRAKMLASQGADLVDIGGESTLAHADRVTPKDQVALLVPIVRELVCEGLIVSIETYYADVAEAALSAGAQVINMTGTIESGAIYKLAAQADAGVIVSYLQGEHARSVENLEFEADPFPQLCAYFKSEIESATANGLDNLILDPGLGYYYRNLEDGRERVKHQLETLTQSFRLRPLGKPICNALPHAFEFFAEEVRSSEPFFAIPAILGNNNLIRTHEVPRIRAILNTLASHSERQPD